MRKKKNLTPLDYALKNRYDLIKWHKLTKDDLTQTNSNGVSLLVGIVGDGQWTNLPPELKEFSLTQPKGACGNEKIIHLMTRQGRIDNIPKSLVTKDLLSLKGARGESVYHILAQQNYELCIDKSLWTRQALTLTSDDGTTPLHIIAPHKPELLPDDITIEDLLLRNKDGDTPLYMWARGSQWTEIPDKFLTKQTLELKVGYGDFDTLMHHIANMFKNDQVLYGTNYNYPLDTKMKKLLCRIGNNLLQSLLKDKDTNLSKHVKHEITKRRILKELSSKEQSLTI